MQPTQPVVETFDPALSASLVDVDRFPEFARDWAANRLGQALANSGAEPDGSDVQCVQAWLQGLPTHRPRMMGKLYKLTWSQALVAAQRWHLEITAHNARMAAQRAAFGGEPDAVTTVLELANGYRWVHIKGAAGLDYEGAAMGHCVGGGGYDDQMIYSLRDGDNMPHATLQHETSSRGRRAGAIARLHGRANKPLAARYVAMVDALVGHEGINRLDYNGNSGCVLVSKHKFSRYVIPTDDYICSSDLSVHGNIHLTNDDTLTALPDGMRVDGSLLVYRCDNLEHLPEGARVSRLFTVMQCHAITHVPAMQSGYSMSFRDCTGLVSVLPGLVTRSDLNLTGCTGLRTLPRGIKVKGDLNLDGCTGLVALQDTNLWSGLCGGSLNLAGCTALERLPSRLLVSKDLNLCGCTGLATLPDELHVMGNLNLQDCSQLKKLPRKLAVGGNLCIRGCPDLLQPALEMSGRRWSRVAGGRVRGRVVFYSQDGLIDACTGQVFLVQS